jgi:hypothetical protein
LSDFLA